MDKTFMCDIISADKEESVDLEQLLIKATSLENAFEKLKNARHYDNVRIYEQRDTVLFAHVETKGKDIPVLHVLIGEPSEVIE